MNDMQSQRDRLCHLLLLDLGKNLIWRWTTTAAARQFCVTLLVASMPDKLVRIGLKIADEHIDDELMTDLCQFLNSME